MIRMSLGMQSFATLKITNYILVFGAFIMKEWYADIQMLRDMNEPIPVVVAICSTLRITDLKGVIKVHTPIMLADLLHYDMPKQILTSAERDEVIGAGDGGYETIAKLLNNKGYDGLVYKNNHEDRGSDSWITLADGQAVPNKPLRLTLADAAQELGITMPKCNSDEIINFAGQSMN